MCKACWFAEGAPRTYNHKTILAARAIRLIDEAGLDPGECGLHVIIEDNNLDDEHLSNENRSEVLEGLNIETDCDDREKRISLECAAWLSGGVPWL